MSRVAPPPFRAAPPASTALIDWPADFCQRFALFVDTEEEFDWAAPLSRDARAVSAVAAIPAAHRRLADAGAAVSYLIDHPVATDARAIDHLRAVAALPGTAIGAQLHPWVNPPFAAGAEPSFPGNLPPEEEAAKLDALTAAITAAFAPPLAYRAGRYGIGPATAELLLARGYRLDSSMRARYDYAREGGPSFVRIGNAAFRCGPGGRLIELPLTTVFTGAGRRWAAPLHVAAGRVPRGRGVLARLGLVSRVALTPEGMPLPEVLEAIRVASGEGVRVLNFSFHSPSLAPGHTPYVRDAADLAAFWRWWDAVLALLAARGVRAASLEQLLAAAG